MMRQKYKNILNQILPKKVGIFLVLPMLSCASISNQKDEPYPLNWPALEKTPDLGCPSLSGIYHYYGETPARRGYSNRPLRLDSAIFRQPAVQGLSKTVTIRHDPQKDFISYQINEDDQPERVFQISCVNGQNTINRQSTHASSEGRFSSAETSVLSKAVDGSLTEFFSFVHTHQFFSIQNKGTGWIRFLPVTK